MTWLLTGATGFLGRHVMARVLSVGPADDVVCLVEPKLRPGQEAVVAAYRAAGVRVIEGDLATGVVAEPPVPRVDVVLHLAANIDTAARGAALDVNDLGTAHLLEWLGRSSRGARIVYSSSIAVHDRKGTSKGRPLNETSPFCPRTEYGTTKRRGEQILQAEAERRGFSYTILRLATVYGPNPKPGGLFDTFAQYGAHNRLAGRLDWPGRTSIIHADDAAALMIEMAQRPDAANQIYCVANPDAPTVGELAREIGRAAGFAVRPIRLPEWIWRATRAVACNRIVYALTPRAARLTLWRFSLIVDHGFWFDTSKLQAVWHRPTKPLADGLAEMFGSEAARFGRRHPCRGRARDSSTIIDRS